MRKQNVDQEVVDAIGAGHLNKVKLSPKDLALLTFVKLLTLTSAHTQDSDVQTMREAGWTDEQIWEVAFEVGMFSFLNRMADVYGLDYPANGWLPPQLRAQREQAKPKETDATAPR